MGSFMGVVCVFLFRAYIPHPIPLLTPQCCLVQAGAKTDFSTPELPLVTAINTKNLSAVELLLKVL